MQLYRGMDIGTAKLPLAERRGIPHHLLDVLEISDEASVAAYQPEARAAIDDILGRGASADPGGRLRTLRLERALELHGSPAPTRQSARALEEELTASGPGMLYQRLAELDPEAAAAIGPHNGRRLVRALEVIELTGETFGAGLPDDSEPWRPVDDPRARRSPREELVPRLDARVERMWARRTARRGPRRSIGERTRRHGRRARSATRRRSRSSRRAHRGGGDRPGAAAHTPVRAPAGRLVPAIPGRPLARLRTTPDLVAAALDTIEP